MLNIDNKIILTLLSLTIIFSALYTFFQFLFKFHPEKKVSKFFFIFFTFLKSIFIVAFIIVGLYFVYYIYSTINQYLTLIELRKYVKNLSKERVLAKIIITDFSDINFNCIIELYSLSGKTFKKDEYQIQGTEFYIDFVVLNFDYIFIEKGENNIAYPSVLFSDLISYDNGIQLLSPEELKNYFSYDSEKFYGLSENKVNSLSNFIFKCISDNSFARKNGVRSIVGSALHHKIFSKSTFKVYLQNTGGLSMVQENF